MPYNPGNVRKLNALGGKRPQATGIAILPKNGQNVLATSEGSVANYGGNKKMGLYSNVGMSYQFQNLNLTGARINGNMPYFWGGDSAITKSSKKTKNMITLKMLDDGNGQADRGTKGFVSAPYWNPLSTALVNASSLDASYRDTHMGTANSKGKLLVGESKIIAIEMWRSGTGTGGPVNYSVAPGIHIWAEKPLSFGSIVIRSGMGKRARLIPTAVYTKDNLPPASSAAAGNDNNAVRAALTAQSGKYYFPASFTSQDEESEIPATTHVYWFAFPDASTIHGANARAIFPDRSSTDARVAGNDLSSIVSIYFD